MSNDIYVRADDSQGTATHWLLCSCALHSSWRGKACKGETWVCRLAICTYITLSKFSLDLVHRATTVQVLYVRYLMGRRTVTSVPTIMINVDALADGESHDTLILLPQAQIRAYLFLAALMGDQGFFEALALQSSMLLKNIFDKYIGRLESIESAR